MKKPTSRSSRRPATRRSTGPWFWLLSLRPHLGLGLRTLVCYAALLAGFMALPWLSGRLADSPGPALSPWLQAEAPLILVDAGHGGHDGGAVAGGVIEKELALTLARHLRQDLQSLGLRVQMTRDADVFLSLDERAAAAEACGAALFVSLHLNTEAKHTVSGIETYYTEHKTLSAQRALQKWLGLTGGAVQDRRGRWLAESVQKKVVHSTGADDRGARSKNYAVVARTPVPAILVECGFLTHADECARLKTTPYQKQITQGIAAGIAQYLQVSQSRPDQGVVAMTAPVPEQDESAAP